MSARYTGAVFFCVRSLAHGSPLRSATDFQECSASEKVCLCVCVGECEREIGRERERERDKNEIEATEEDNMRVKYCD